MCRKPSGKRLMIWDKLFLPHNGASIEHRRKVWKGERKASKDCMGSEGFITGVGGIWWGRGRYLPFRSPGCALASLGWVSRVLASGPQLLRSGLTRAQWEGGRGKGNGGRVLSFISNVCVNHRKD